MSNLVLIIPFIFAALLIIFYRNKILIWEYLILIGAAILVNIITVSIMKSSNCSDVEYFGDHIVKSGYYEEWDEYVHEICTSTDGEGNTTTYDCSHVDTHSPYWEVTTSLGKTHRITKNEHDYLIKLWGKSPVFINMKRDFYSINGNQWVVYYDKKIENIIPITTEEYYSNKIQGSTSSVFKFSSVEDSIKFKLFNYPPLTDINKPFIEKSFQNTVMGYDNNKEFINHMNYINAKYGPTKHIRTYVLFFNDLPREYAFHQRSYWSGGNFNEHVICIGLEKNSNKFSWVETFSWEDTPNIKVKTKQWLESNDSIQALNKFSYWYENLIASDNIWKNKNGDDFNYLDIELSTTQLIWAFIISIVTCIGLSIWLILNDYKY